MQFKFVFLSTFAIYLFISNNLIYSRFESNFDGFDLVKFDNHHHNLFMFIEEQ